MEFLASDDLPEHISNYAVYLEELIDNIKHCEIETNELMFKAREMFVVNIT